MKRQTFASNRIGSVMEVQFSQFDIAGNDFQLLNVPFPSQTMTAVTIPTKIHYTVRNERVPKTVSDAQIIDAYRLHGIVMATMIAVMVPMNRQSIASRRVEHASVICLRATMEIAFPEFISATETMIVWTIVTKMTDINAVSSLSSLIVSTN